MSEKGKNIMGVFRYVNQFFSEIAQVIQKSDDCMEREGWKPLYGNRVTTNVSKDLLRPKDWMPSMNFRVYTTSGNPNLIKGVTFCYNAETMEQPIIILGMVEYKDKKSLPSWQDYWILWNLWREDKNEPKKLDGTIYKEFNTEDMKLVKKAKLFAYNLVDIKNEADIKNKLTNNLIKLK